MQKRQIAITRRNVNNHPPLEINETRLYLNCSRSILNEIAAIEADPAVLRLDVLSQRRNSSCLICNAVGDMRRLSIACRVNIFLVQNIYVPENVRACVHHFDKEGLLPRLLLAGLTSINLCD